MGEISDVTKIGIITFIDKRYNYVWNTNLGPLELRFPLNPQLEFQPGEIVRYVQSHDGLAPQIVHNLLRHNKQLNVERSSKLQWKIEVNLVFASRTSKEFREAMENDDEDRIKGIAWAQDFLLVASYLEGVEYKAGVVYRAYITRIPNRWETLASKVGTIFAIIGKKFEACTDHDALATFWSLCPWKIEASNSEDCDIGLPVDSDSPNNDCNGTINRNVSTRNIIYQEEEVPYFAEALNNLNEGEEKTGLVVICEKEYSVIWNPVDDLVRVQVGQLLKDGDDNLPMWPLCEWVKYRCMPEESQISNNVICKYTAYDIKKTKAINDVTLLKDDTVAVKCRLSSAKAHSSVFFIANDSFFQSVLCSCQDRILKEQMEDENASVDIYAVFTDIYKHSRWIAFAFRNKDCWRKIDGLPPTVDSQIRPFFTRFENRSSSAYDTMHNDKLATNRFKAPTDWKGSHYEGEKIVDAIGIVVCFEDQTTVLATKFGLARQPIKFPLGVWVLTTIVPDEKPSQSFKNNMRDLESFIVKRSKKIGPVMSTRVVNDKGIDKLLICCPVKANASKSFGNEYLGKVDDPDNLVKPYQNGQFCVSGYLVELCLSRSREDGSRFWKILKNHGDYNKTVNIVALKLSYFPHSEGQTCDDAHTILLDPIYEAEDELFTNQKQSNHNNNDIHATTLKPVPRNSSYWETLSANNKQPFASTLPYQPPKLPTICPQKPDISESLTSQQQTSLSKSSQNIKPSNRIVSNCGIDDLSNISKQLTRYQPVGESKRQIGIVVAKNANFAILYTKLYGDAIVLTRYIQSKEQFDELFMLGRFIGASFSRVNDPVQNELTYKMMCLPEFKLNNKNIVKTRVVLGQFVQAYVECDFSKNKIKECTEEMKECTENERRYYIDTAIGFMLLNSEVVDKNDFLGKVVGLWLTHIQKCYGCFWQIALNEMNTFQGGYILEYDIIKDRVIVNDEQTNNSSTSCTISNNLLKEEKNKGNILPFNLQQQKQTITAKSLSGLTGNQMSDFFQQLDQNESSLLPNFANNPPVPNKRNLILKPEPITTKQHLLDFNEYDKFLFGNYSDSLNSKHGSIESFNTDHCFSDISSNIGDRDLIVCGSTPPPTFQSNFESKIQKNNKIINQNNICSQSWDDIGLGTIYYGNDNNNNSDDNDFIVNNKQNEQQTIGPSISKTNNNVNRAVTSNIFNGPIGFDSDISFNEKKNNNNSDDLIIF